MQPKVDVAVEFDNIEAIKRAMETGSGLSLLPRPALDRENQVGTLSAVPPLIEWLRKPGTVPGAA